MGVDWSDAMPRKGRVVTGGCVVGVLLGATREA